jgi:limonene-1,2-epoxide hydrolase
MNRSQLMHTNDVLVREFLLLWEQRDTDKLVAACTEDAVWHHRPLPPAVGSDGIREFAQRFADVPGGPYEILLQVADDRVVMNERLDRVTVGGQLAELRSCGVFEIEDGRIKAWRDYFDTGSLAHD